MNLVSSEWKLKKLLYWNLLSIFLLLSFISPYGKIVWDLIDLSCFRVLNNSLRYSQLWKLFWAFANHKNADWIQDGIILLFFILSFRAMPNKRAIRKLAEIVFLLIYGALVIVCINMQLFRKHLDIYRPSPTVIEENCVRLSKELPWLEIKDRSLKSFPADHGTTALLFAAGFSFFTSSRKLRLYAILYSIFTCIPRVVLGAHWLSDIIIGGGLITITTMSLALCTPFHARCIDKIENFFGLCRRRVPFKAD